jgi:hypothetical protein
MLRAQPFAFSMGNISQVSQIEFSLQTAPEVAFSRYNVRFSSFANDVFSPF